MAGQRDPMPDLLTAKQLAEYLQVSPRSIYRLLQRGGVPATKVGGQWRFRKADVDQWIDLNATTLPEELSPLNPNSASGYPDPGDLLEEANAFIRLPAVDRDAVVRDFVGRILFPEAVDLGLIVNRVLERERLCSTALLDGVALLHTPRNRPRVLKTHDVVALGRLERPVDFGALDGSLTDILVLILARDERRHLGLLAKMARLFREPALLRGLRATDTARAMVALVRRTEETIFTPAAVTAR